jgi:penicillin amidase
MERRTLAGRLPALAICALFMACGDGNGTSTDTGLDAMDVPSDGVAQDGIAEDDGPGTDAPDAADPGGDVAPILCIGDLEANKQYAFPGLDGEVQVLKDMYGVPHIYAGNMRDAFFAQGFVTATDRIIQMQGLRLITRGTYGATSVAGPSDLSTDVYMRIIGLRRTAEAMWQDIQANEPEVKEVLEAFAAGVNAYMGGVADRKISPPIEWTFLGQWDPWSPVDSLTIGRLQSWDLSFDQYVDEVTMMQTLEAILTTFQGTPRAGLAMDMFRVAPSGDDTIIPVQEVEGIASLGKVPTVNPRELDAAIRLLERMPHGYFGQVASVLDSLAIHPGNIALGGGSNNWAVAGSLTESGHAMVAGDPHLSLRNPAVFYHVHMDTTRAGGDLSIEGVSFPGIPGIILGHNGKAAWMATVHNYDATDVYIEFFDDDEPGKVVFDGDKVALQVLKESFTFPKPDGGCESGVVGIIRGMPWTVSEEDDICNLEVDIEIVPHHGPIIPGSRAELPNGTKIALTWRWTGFEPTGELKAVFGLWKAGSPQEFMDALQDFGVGAQNWMYGDVDGHIAYAAPARVPIRKHMAEGNGQDHPPWLPMPGDGCCEWTGYVPLGELPQAVDPQEGFLLTANHDAFGTTLDNNVLNDSNYLAQTYDIGFRGTRVRELLNQKTAAGKVGVADMQDIQADHRSPLGAEMVPGILLAIDAGQAAVDEEDESNPRLVPYMTDQVKAAGLRLAEWNFMAASGVGDDVPTVEAEAAVATSIFNAWLVFLVRNLLADEGLTGHSDQYLAKFLVQLFRDPTVLASHDAVTGDNATWDDLTTEDVVETREEIILKSLADALAFLSDPDAVGPAASGGFGTDDMDQWLWGRLHTITLRHALGGDLNIPPASVMPDGFPRHGDNYVVDASNPGLSDTRFTYQHGPSMRAVYVMDLAGVRMVNALPGGQSGEFTSAHYADDMALWALNQTHPVPFLEEAVIDAAEACWLMKP